MTSPQTKTVLPPVTGSQVTLIALLAFMLVALIAFLVWQLGGDALPWLSSIFGLTATGVATVGFAQNRQIQATTAQNSQAIQAVDAQLNGPMSAKVQASVEAAIVAQHLATVEDVTGITPSAGDHVAPPVAPPVPDAGPVSP